KLRADIPSGSFSTTRLSGWLSKCEAALPGCRFFQSGPLANGWLLGCSVTGCLRCTYLKSPLEIVVKYPQPGGFNQPGCGYSSCPLLLERQRIGNICSYCDVYMLVTT